MDSPFGPPMRCKKCRTLIPAAERICAKCGHDMRIGSPKAYARVGWVIGGLCGTFPGALVGYYVWRLVSFRPGPLTPEALQRSTGADLAPGADLLIVMSLGALVGAVCGFLTQRRLTAHWQEPPSRGGPYADQLDGTPRRHGPRRPGSRSTSR